ncbi:MAG: hypothetical protein GC189_04865 [Alphaproteobacteria bacterium]|nr:hypothetical protein [Alphaproteobacteria bacterium]
MRLNVLGAVFALAAAMSGRAAAEPGLAGEVYGPAVTAGSWEVETRFGVLNGGPEDGEWAAVAEANYAVSDWWRPAALIEVEQPPDGDVVVEAVAIENVFDIIPTRSWPVHLGAYAEYEWNTQGGPDKIELRALAERVRGPLRLRLNAIAEREVGGGAAEQWAFEYAAQGLWSLNDDVALGLEGFGELGTDDNFGDLGDRAHYWGPVAAFEAFESSAGELEVLAGYLFAVGEAEADGQVRLILAWER